jgi:hypothetical protein
MPNRFARKTGNWNAADVWSDTPSGTAGAEFIPVAGDVAYSNSFTVTVNVNATCTEVRNDNSNGATQGGGFTLTDGVMLTANAFAGAASTSVITLGSGSATLAGSAVAGTGVNAHGASNTGSATLIITGDVTANSGFQSRGVQNSSTGTVAIGGDVVGVGANPGVYNHSTGTIASGGDAIGGSSAGGFGAHQQSTGTITVAGAVRCGNAASGIGGGGNGIVVVGGPLYRKSTADGGDSYIQPIVCNRWAFDAASTNQYEVGLHSSGVLVTFGPTEAPVVVNADLMARLQQVSTVATTGAQIAALGPVD